MAATAGGTLTGHSNDLARRDALSVVIPAYDEEAGIGAVLKETISVLEGLGVDHEIIVVDDASRDRTAEIARASGVTLVQNLENGGYGYALLRGIRRARYRAVAIVDADGSYPIRSIPQLFEPWRRGYAMVVGRRQGEHYVDSPRMRLLRWLFRSLAEFIGGRSIPDVNSGMRIFDRQAVLPMLPFLSTGYSFTTSITLLFMMRALPVTYVPIDYHPRMGSSKVRLFRDSLRALQIMASITARLNPIKLFLLAALANVLVMLPMLALLTLLGDSRTAWVLVAETSALLAGLGFLVEALVDKQPFEIEADEPEADA
jgi:glycosyltransferase involved in cell wall biosynthesis